MKKNRGCGFFFIVQSCVHVVYLAAPILFITPCTCIYFSETKLRCSLKFNLVLLKSILTEDCDFSQHLALTAYFNRVKPVISLCNSLLCACNYLPRPCLCLRPDPLYSLFQQTHLVVLRTSRALSTFQACNLPCRTAVNSSSHTLHPHTTPAQRLGTRL
ncbi:hypothetical protein BZL39_P02210 [Zygosaccharomyces parabailii]|nr:hypothetical protein BZL39_P02210 [Zygosaccharomyces parabailii]